jgi:predicted XRE-type DNA-binding protein
MTSKPTTVTVGSGNVFADIGFENAEETLMRATAVYQISRIIDARKLRQVDVARLLGIKQPDVSAMLNGRLTKFTLERLLKFLTILGKDVEIVVKNCPARRPARMTMAAA